ALWDIVQGASFVILPSEWYENNPLSVIESFAYGKPVIGSSIGGIPEIIRHGDTGFLFEPGNLAQLKVSLLLANELNGEDYGRMSRACRVFAEDHFQETRHYGELLSIYERLLNTNKN
ncbi:MAG TPA: glycosyltransferase family 4 protein, partial [Chitinophagaceae bacterium]